MLNRKVVREFLDKVFRKLKITGQNRLHLL